MHKRSSRTLSYRALGVAYFVHEKTLCSPLQKWHNFLKLVFLDVLTAKDVLFRNELALKLSVLPCE